MAHTKGPWQIDRWEGDEDDEAKALNIRRGSERIAVVDQLDGEITPQLEADACLIAAAPDLLAVAHRVAELFESTDSSIGIDARLAIAKAEKGAF
jgi:hypothetical protein